jgi:F-type H+-transporting ATPase subunit epsilon
MQVDLVDSEKQIFSGQVEYLVAPAYDGEIGIFPNHVPLIVKLKSGVLRLQVPGEEFQMVFAISGGFLEVKGNHVTVLADVVERTDELDEARLKEQMIAAQAREKHVDSSMTADVAKAQAALEIAIAQLKALDYIKKQANR